MGDEDAFVWKRERDANFKTVVALANVADTMALNYFPILRWKIISAIVAAIVTTKIGSTYYKVSCIYIFHPGSCNCEKPIFSYVDPNHEGEKEIQIFRFLIIMSWTIFYNNNNLCDFRKRDYFFFMYLSLTHVS